MRVVRIVSGGQAGADRAGLDAALEHGRAYGGWCPAGGWAEDLPEPPGLLAHYPLLQATASTVPSVRSRLNVRDSDATLVVRGPSVRSPGTDLTVTTAVELGRPHLVGESDADAVSAWLVSLGDALTLNVAGPRESEQPGVYALARSLLSRVLRADR